MSQLGDFVKSLEAVAGAEFDKIKSVAASFLQSAETEIENFVGGEAVKLEQLAGPAMQFVLAEAPKLITGQEKFGNAVTSLVQFVEGQNWGVYIKDAEMAIQAAFNKARETASTLL